MRKTSSSRSLREKMLRYRWLWDQALHWKKQGKFWIEVIPLLQKYKALQASVYWMAALVVGVMAVVYRQCFDFAVVLSEWVLINYPILFVSMCPVFLVLSRFIIVRMSLSAAGSGIPQVMAAMSVQSEYAGRWVGIRIGAVKIISSFFAGLGAGVLGPEGPTIQIAAGIFYSFGRFFRRIWPDLNHQNLIVAGGAAGIAAAFNTPLGGIVYAIEELSSRNFHRFKTMLITAVIIAGLVSQVLEGPYLYFGFPKLPQVTFQLMPWAVAVGLVVGLLAGIFGKVFRKLGGWSEKLINNYLKSSYAVAFVAGILLALMAYSFGPAVMGSGTDLIRHLLFEDSRSISWEVVIGRFFAPLITGATGVAGGIFAPSLAAGAAIGAKIALVSAPQNANYFIILGMIAFLSGVTRAPFTSFVLVMEMTDRYSAVFPMMMASLLATLAAKIIDSKSYYERATNRILKTVPKEMLTRKKKIKDPKGNKDA